MNVGDVLRVHTTLVNPAKTKIVMYVGKHAATDLFLWFNTEPRRARPAQMRVGAQEVPGIARDCFLDCGRVTTFPTRELDRAEHCGRGSQDFLAKVAREVEDHARTLATAHRKAVAAMLRDAIRRSTPPRAEE
jgi:hypothetical protein